MVKFPNHAKYSPLDPKSFYLFFSLRMSLIFLFLPKVNFVDTVLTDSEENSLFFCQIDFWESRNPKTAVFVILGALEMVNSEPLNVSKRHILHF